jgi:hypothetical protein
MVTLCRWRGSCSYMLYTVLQANGTAFDSHQRSAFCENCPPGDVDVPSTIYCTNCLISLCDECEWLRRQVEYVIPTYLYICFSGDGTIHRSSAMQRHKRAFHQVGKLLNESYLNNGADPEPVKYQLCPNHNDLLKLYCFTCNELVCRECVSDMMPTYGSTTSNGNFRGGNHWQHCVQFMSQVARHRRALLSDHIEQLESISRIMVWTYFTKNFRNVLIYIVMCFSKQSCPIVVGFLPQILSLRTNIHFNNAHETFLHLLPSIFAAVLFENCRNA